MKIKINVFSLLIILFVVLVFVGIFFAGNKSTKSNNKEIGIDENGKPYIDVWRDNSMDMDIDLYSTGSGINEKLYLGNQPVHYQIYKDGKVYTYQASSYKNKMTGISDPPKVTYIKTLSQNDIETIKNKLQTLMDKSENKMQIHSTNWYIKIGEKKVLVNTNVYVDVLEEYIDEAHEDKVFKRELSIKLHDFMKEKCGDQDPISYDGPFSLVNMAEEDKNTILKEFKAANDTKDITDEELIGMIDGQAIVIWGELLQIDLDEEGDR